MSRNSTTHRCKFVLPDRGHGLSQDYFRWKESRLAQADASVYPVIPLPVSPFLQKTETASLTGPIVKALARICAQVQEQGFSVYRFTDAAQNVAELTLEQSQFAATTLAHQLGLRTTDDGVIREAAELSLLQDHTGTPRGRFIPYTNKRMNWHTDGYYNRIDSSVRCFTLHCAQPAEQGGSLLLMDPELLLIALHEDDPGLVMELSRPDTMMLPANTDNQGHNRPNREVPVFFSHPDNALGMRFTTRTENIHWRTPDTGQAAQRVTEIIEASAHWHTRVLLQAGEGVISRNVLHQREAYNDHSIGSGRKMLRGRYLHLPELAHSEQSFKAVGDSAHAAR